MYKHKTRASPTGVLGARCTLCIRVYLSPGCVYKLMIELLGRAVVAMSFCMVQLTFGAPATEESAVLHLARADVRSEGTLQS
jgi:hypothetical protein